MTLSQDVKAILKTSFFSAIFTVVLLMIVNYFFNHTWNLFGNALQKQPFTVQGTGSVTAKHDTAQISFTVRKTAQTLNDAQNQANTFTNTSVAHLEQIGINKDDIKTENYTSFPNYSNNEQTQPVGIMVPFRQQSTTIESYTVSETSIITIHDITKANAVIDNLTKDGAEDISGPMLTFSDKQQKEFTNQAQSLAITDAKQKAQNLANAVGIHLGKIIGIQENNTNPFPIQPLLMKTTANGNAATTQINPGENTVTATVSLSYETY